jgi:gamma-glutamylcyclotransferase (GGCT)/AIG2-like uncharacterized protein YtfP
MDPTQMEFRCPGASPIGIGILKDFRFLINSRGVATIARDEGRSVYGVLWSISEEHERTLDKYEGVKSNIYYRDFVSVETPSGGTEEALVYIDPVTDPGPPKDGYLEKILTGARHFNLPEKYIEDLSLSTVA